MMDKLVELIKKVLLNCRKTVEKEVGCVAN